jgi:hypothetical protein
MKSQLQGLGQQLPCGRWIAIGMEEQRTELNADSEPEIMSREHNVRTVGTTPYMRL